jgi:hypothetical protein
LSRVLTDENDQTYGFRNSFRRRAAHSLPCRAAHLHLDETVAIQIALTNFIEIETRSVVNRYDDAAVRQKKTVSAGISVACSVLHTFNSSDMMFSK